MTHEVGLCIYQKTQVDQAVDRNKRGFAEIDGESVPMNFIADEVSTERVSSVDEPVSQVERENYFFKFLRSNETGTESLQSRDYN
jgi:hypothetical protein